MSNWLACSPSPWRSEFESRRHLQFFSVKFVFEKTKINKKRPGWPVLKNATKILPSQPGLTKPILPFAAGNSFLKIGQPRPLFHLFSVFSNKLYNFATNQCEKMSWPSSIRLQDSNPWPLEHESPPITTRTGHQFVLYRLELGIYVC